MRFKILENPEHKIFNWFSYFDHKNPLDFSVVVGFRTLGYRCYFRTAKCATHLLPLVIGSSLQLSIDGGYFVNRGFRIWSALFIIDSSFAYRDVKMTYTFRWIKRDGKFRIRSYQFIGVTGGRRSYWLIPRCTRTHGNPSKSEKCWLMLTDKLSFAES